MAGHASENGWQWGLSWINEMRGEELPQGYLATLPTEGEWEYACRAGSETEYCSGDGEAALGEVGWFADNSGGSTRPVGQLTGNAFGLHDMHGNVDEWCWDIGDEDAYKRRVDGVVNPGAAERLRVMSDEQLAAGPSGGIPDRVVRGGSWCNSAGGCRSACRGWGRPGVRSNFRDFRVCLVPGPVSGGE